MKYLHTLDSPELEDALSRYIPDDYFTNSDSENN